MSADRPTGGDGLPDRFSGREDRPFPGAPEDREPVPELPRNTLSMEEVRAVHRRSGSNAEFEAAARAHAQAQAAGVSDSPGPKAPDQGFSGERSAEADGDSTAPGTRPGAQDAGADGFARPDRAKELPPFPGAPEERGPVPELPRNTLSMEEVRALHQRSNSNAEFEAMAAQYAAATKETFAPGADSVRAVDARDGFFGRTEDLQDQGAPELGEREDGEHDRVDARTSADTSQQARRGEETGVEKDGEGQEEDGQEQKPRDLVQVQHPVPETETERLGEVASEAAPDQQPDDPRWAAMETRMAEFASMFEAMQAKLDASEARNEELAAKNERLEAKVGDLETGRQEDQEKIRELEAKVEGWDAVREQQELAEDNEQTESLLNPDVIRSDEYQDDLSAAEQADAAELSDGADDQAGREAYETSAETGRAGISEDTAQAGQDALSLAGSLGIVNPLVSLAVSADSARRKFEKMAPADQLDVINLTDSATKAFGSMPPGTAVVAVTVGTVAPLVGDKVRNAIHHFRRKD